MTRIPVVEASLDTRRAFDLADSVVDVETSIYRGSVMSQIIKSTALMSSLLLAAVAHAANNESDRWEFQATLYLYLPTFGGTADFPPHDNTDEVSLSIDQILEGLKFVFMGSFEARRGQWGAFTDVIYMDLGASKSGTRTLEIHGVPLPATASANVDFDLKGLAWTLAATRRVIDMPEVTLDILAGTRLLDLTPKVDWTLNGNVGSVPIPDRAGSSKQSLNNWDAIVGAKGRFAFGSELKWYVPYYIDIGTGESDLTFQAMVGLGYAFKWGDLFAAWRYIDYSMGNDTAVRTLSLNGPLAAATFHW